MSNTNDTHRDNAVPASAVVSFDPAKDPAAVSLTQSAAAHLGKSLEKNDAEAVRLGVTESGCNGYMYDLSFAAAVDPADHRYEFPLSASGQSGAKSSASGAITVVVSKQDLPLVQGTQIDYVTEGLNSALKFSNPNADTHCGCGESFSVSAPDA